MAHEVIPPPYLITTNDKRGLIVVTVAIVLAFVWVCSLIRIWLRYKARDWKNDDTLLAAATILHTIQSGIIFHVVDLGLGVSQDRIPQSQLEQIGREGFATQNLYVCTLYLSKCSVLFLYLQLSPDSMHKLSSFIGLGASSIWGLVAVILVSVPCNPAQLYVVGSSHCTNRWPKWQAIGALDIVTEVFIFCVAIQLVWTLQMRLKSKLMITVAFSARLPVIAIAGIRLYYLGQRLLVESSTFSYLVVGQWQMGYAIMSSTITGMGPLLRPFDTEYTMSYKNSSYGPNAERSLGNSRLHDTKSQPEAQRSSCQSEIYLMQPMTSRRASKHTLSESANASVVTSGITSAALSPSTTPEQQGSPPAPNLLTADANFRPVDNISRNESEVWVGERSHSFRTNNDMPNNRESSGLVINKETQFTIEVDRASRVT